ncbi:MAG: acyloxyacyl hydrolase, partial [Bacteroidaceae bacterium]|nr:acyloxyacyl hydrolase [Bacteroidaceae bacterium]
RFMTFQRTLLPKSGTAMALLVLSVMLFGMASAVCATPPDSTFGHWGIGADIAPGRVMHISKYGKDWVIHDNAVTFGGELRYQTSPSDNDPYAKDYNYPAFGVGVRKGDYDAVTLHRTPTPEAGEKWEAADYKSQLGNIVSVYGFFERPIVRKNHWQVDYRINIGASYALRTYNAEDNVDNVMIGSNWNFYFGAGVHYTFFFAPEWGARIGAEYTHNSCGAMYKPNKGINFFSPMVGLIYRDTRMREHELSWSNHNRPRGRTIGGGRYAADSRKNFHRPTLFGAPLYLRLSGVMGFKAIMESTGADGVPEINSHGGKNRFYMCYGWQTDLMCRYARRWSSGIGVDVLFAEEAFRLSYIDRMHGYYGTRHIPWQIGIAGKHEVHYGNVAMTLALGFYALRHMGPTDAKETRKFYERIGMKYNIPGKTGLFLGINVKAHAGKASHSELVLGIDI